MASDTPQSEFRFDDRVTIITGAGSGIGRDMAISFARQGAKVAITGRRPDPLEETADLAGKEGRRPLVIPGDVSVEDHVEGFVEQVVKELGPVDNLVSNAAEPGKDMYLQDETLENWHACIATNITAPMLLARACLPHMLPRRSGAIVTLSSGAALEPMERKGHYSVTKMGLISLTRNLALEVGPQGVRANCIVVGATATELAKRYYERIAGERGVPVEEVLKEFTDRPALKRQVQPPRSPARPCSCARTPPAPSLARRSAWTAAGRSTETRAVAPASAQWALIPGRSSVRLGPPGPPPNGSPILRRRCCCLRSRLRMYQLPDAISGWVRAVIH